MMKLEVEIPERVSQWDARGVDVERCFEPSTIVDLGLILEAASKDRLGVLIIGGATRLGWSNSLREIGVGISTLGLEGVDTFEPDEGVLHARAGTRVVDVQRVAHEAGWELPIDAPGLSSTIGGVISSAATGPRAQTFGRVADAILGLEIVGADGVATKCGGRVVKNVTGYDLAKLYCGALGTLGLITGAWLRLRPVAAEKRALFAPLPKDPKGLDACRRLARLTGVRALTWVEGRGADDEEGVYFEIGGSAAEVNHDLAAIEAACSVTRIDSARIDALRDTRADARESEVVLRVRVLPADAASIMSAMRAAGLAMSVDLGLGVLHARGGADSIDTLERLGEAVIARGGSMTLERLPDAWREEVDVFGLTEDTRGLHEAIQAKFDPHGILNPGRFFGRG